jgi:LysR family hydrogen peroxide-inducible transcriptional activator
MRSIGLVWRKPANAGMFERLSDVIKDAARANLQTGQSPVILD